MSSFLYRLGRRAARHARTVVVAWFAVFLVAGGLAATAGGELRNEFNIPGTESQEGLDVLETRFPEVSGASGTILFRAPEGRIGSFRDAIEARIKAVEDVDHVMLATDPFSRKQVDLSVTDDRRSALAQVQLDQPAEQLDPDTLHDVERAATRGLPGGLEAHVGGQMFMPAPMGVSITEVIGLVVALVVLVLTLGSIVAAGIPLLTAVLGVGITLAGVVALASVFSINTSTPSLAMMIGLAVGIDYALLLSARHREQLAEGMDVEESVARSVATAGSAVIFAGVTVIIALCGLVVAGIPFLSVMGLAGGAAVAMAVGIAITLVPAVLSLAGERLRPRRPRYGQRTERSRVGVGSRWVALATRRPAVTTALVVTGLLLLAIPVKDLTLGLTDNGSAEEGSTERVTYDLVEQEYGPGFNSPLLVTADIIRTRDPIGVMERLGKDIGRLRGVQAVALTTPNRSADLGIVQVVPEHGQTDRRTADLVREIRDKAGDLEDEYGVTDLRVTGQTAVTIDVSKQLGGALLPFGLLVVGLSLILLMAVFRSVAVPLKATAGYLLSVGATLGLVVMVFQYGWLAGPLGVQRPGVVIAFLPIMLMGILFGLAMDYEVFLVSRMREHWVHGGDALRAIDEGFSASSRVVVAAAVIMVSVFASFVPHGDSSVKPVAFALAVGVLLDAFVVRMTLVPAVLKLLGDRAWRLPSRLDERLPALDVEGEGLAAHLEHERWLSDHGPTVVRVEDLGIDDPHLDEPVVAAVDLTVAPGEVAVLTGDPLRRRAVLAVLAGRMDPSRGRVVVLGRILPAESGGVRARTAIGTQVPGTDVPGRSELLLLDLDELSAADAETVHAHAEAGLAVVLAGPPELADALVAAGTHPTRTLDLTDKDHEEVRL